MSNNLALSDIEATMREPQSYRFGIISGHDRRLASLDALVRLDLAGQIARDTIHITVPPIRTACFDPGLVFSGGETFTVFARNCDAP